MSRRNKKSQQHQEFPSGLPSKYYPGPMLLNFSDRTRTGVFNMVWPLTSKRAKYSLENNKKWYADITLLPLQKERKGLLKNNTKKQAQLLFDESSIFQKKIICLFFLTNWLFSSTLSIKLKVNTLFLTLLEIYSSFCLQA